MYRVIRSPLLALAAALLAAGAPPAADARPHGYYPGAGRAWVGWGGGYRPGWGAWGGWGCRAPYYGYGLGIATGAALGWSLAAPWWPATAWSGVGYGYPQIAYPYPHVGVAAAAPAEAIEPVYVERPQEVVVQPAPQARPGRWYYCTDPAGYYPYVASCSQPWVAVIPRADARSSSPANGAATPQEAR